ncbi:MAG: TIM barrel protein [Bryobacterales bacterium]|nr:TIM barrel protein [Bryobacterales bacterium]
MSWSRRGFLSAAAAVTAMPAGGGVYQVGITTNTRGGWEKDVWLSFREAREVGYLWVESFWSYFTAFDGKPAELRAKVEGMGVRFTTISNSGPMEMHFEDPARHDKLVADHVKLARFIRELGCTHLKINLGPRRPAGTTDEDLKQMAGVLERLGKATQAEGIRLAVHAHMWSQFENRREIDYVMAHTDAKRVWFVLDTGHITMAGIDPVELTKKLGHRIVEFHLKDCKVENKGGAKVRLERPDMMADPPFFPLGSGGVDFAAIKQELERIGWKGAWTVELDSSPQRPPQQSARMSYDYIRQELGIDPSASERKALEK